MELPPEKQKILLDNYLLIASTGCSTVSLNAFPLEMGVNVIMVPSYGLSNVLAFSFGKSKKGKELATDLYETIKSLGEQVISLLSLEPVGAT